MGFLTALEIRQRRCCLASLLIVAGTLATGAASAQTYPARPVTLVVPGPAMVTPCVAPPMFEASVKTPIARQ